MRTPALLLLAATACGTTDPRCTVANCQTAIDACGTLILGVPETTFCTTGGLTPPPGMRDNRAVQCAESCVAGNQGEAIACLTSLKVQCEDAGTPLERLLLSNSCASTRAFNPSCSIACTGAFNTCRTACPKAKDWPTCENCLHDCGLRAASCQAGC